MRVTSLFLALALLLVLFIPGQSSAQNVFDPLVSYSVGASPTGLAYGKFDNDQYMDLVLVNQSSNQIKVLLNNGDGTFGTPAVYASSAGPWNVYAADLDEDGYDDIIVANSGSQVYSVLLNDGDGTGSFGARTDLPITSSPYDLTVGDFDRDNHLDLALVNLSNALVVLGNGDGTFGSPTYYPVGTEAINICAGDFNNDACLDLAAANSESDDVSILLNNGDGTFTTGGTFQRGGGIRLLFKPVILIMTEIVT